MNTTKFTPKELSSIEQRLDEIDVEKEVFLTKEDAQKAFRLLQRMNEFIAFSDDGDYFIGDEGEEFNDLCAKIDLFVGSIKH